MPSWFPLVATVAGTGLMYFVCIRPMRRGTCGPAGRATKDTKTDAILAGAAVSILAAAWVTLEWVPTGPPQT